MVTVKRITVSVLVLAALATGALAQDYIFTNFAASRDIPVPPSPCILKDSAQPVVYDTSIWLFYTCLDGRVIARRFYHQNDQAALARPQPVIIVQPAAAPQVSTSTTAVAAGCPVGFVSGIQGGCVPPDHPMAK